MGRTFIATELFAGRHIIFAATYRIRLSDWISPPGSRTRRHPDTTQLDNAQPAVFRLSREASSSATRPHLMASPEVIPYAFIDVVVDRPIHFGRRAVAEVCAPIPQSLIKSNPNPGTRL